jgi:hypothetical protein
MISNMTEKDLLCYFMAHVNIDEDEAFRFAKHDEGCLFWQNPTLGGVARSFAILRYIKADAMVKVIRDSGIQ